MNKSKPTKPTAAVRWPTLAPMEEAGWMEAIKTSLGAFGTVTGSKKVGQFVLDDFNGFEDLVHVASTGDHHLAGSEDEADDLGHVESVDEAGELFRLVLNFVKGQVEVRWLRLSLRGTPAWGSPVNLSTPS